MCECIFDTIGSLHVFCHLVLRQLFSHLLSFIIYRHPSQDGGLIYSTFLSFPYTDAVFINNLRGSITPKLIHMPIDMIISSLARMSYHNQDSNIPFLRSLAYALLRRFSELKSWQKVAVFKALGNNEFYPEIPLLEKILDELIKDSTQYNTFQLATIAWAAGVLRLDNFSLFLALENALVSRAKNDEKVPLNQIADALWSFAAVNIPPSPQFWKLVTDVTLRAISARNFDLSAIARIGWSATVFQHYDPELLGSLCHGVLSISNNAFPNDFRLSQLHFVCVL